MALSGPCRRQLVRAVTGATPKKDALRGTPEGSLHSAERQGGSCSVEHTLGEYVIEKTILRAVPTPDGSPEWVSAGAA